MALANLIVTQRCQLSCDFCFAGGHMKDAPDDGSAHLALDTYREQLRFLGDGAVRLCGGEPSAHPRIVTLIELALAKPGRQVFIMTNGIWPAKLQRYFRRLSVRTAARIQLLINVLPADAYRPGQRAQLERTLGSLMPRQVTLGVTVDRSPLDVEHVFELAARFGIAQMRYSVASPSIDDAASWALADGEATL